MQASARAMTLIELLVAIAMIAALACLLLVAVVKALHHARATVARIEFAHFAKTVRYLGEPDPRILDNDGREMYYTTHPHFTNWLFTIEKD